MLPSPRRLRTLLVGSSLLLAAVGLGAEVDGARRGEPARRLVELLSLSYERNLPTAFASGLLLGCALALLAHARAAAQHRKRWHVLAALFAYLAVDEAVGLHEALGVLDLHGVLYFSWVVPAAALVLALGLFYLPFVRALPAPLRGQVVRAGVLYVGGALGMELPLGWWTERHGDANLTYALLDHVEELLELLGAALFLAALVEHLPSRASARELARG